MKNLGLANFQEGVLSPFWDRFTFEVAVVVVVAVVAVVVVVVVAF